MSAFHSCATVAFTKLLAFHSQSIITRQMDSGGNDSQRKRTSDDKEGGWNQKVQGNSGIPIKRLDQGGNRSQVEDSTRIS